MYDMVSVSVRAGARLRCLSAIVYYPPGWQAYA